MPIKEFQHCMRCGRKLRSARSRLIGYGAVCEAKMKVEKSRQLFNPDGEQKEKPLD